VCNLVDVTNDWDVDFFTKPVGGTVHTPAAFTITTFRTKKNNLQSRPIGMQTSQ